MNDPLHLSMLTPKAVEYSWEQLAQRAGFTDAGSFLAVDDYFQYCALDQAEIARPGIIVVPCSKDSWQSLLDAKAQTLDFVPVDQVFPVGIQPPFSRSIPVLFWGAGYEDGRKPFVQRTDDGMVIFYADIVAATFFMLSRWEETVVPTRDQHNRFAATASVAYKQGFLDRPIVDEYALILQAWLKLLLPNWQPQAHLFSVKLSHDIDSVRSSSLWRLGGDLLKRQSLGRAVQTAKELLLSEQDFSLRGCRELAQLSEQNSFQSAFYFMAAARNSFDNGYDVNSKPVWHLIRELRQRGHEIGFHPGYSTWDNPDRFMLEKCCMDRALGETQYGGRQHYLRFSVPHTWRLWESAGLSYDSTLSYADYEGFRCGSCHPFRPFDIELDRPLNLLEIPLIVMDGTLKQYRNLTPEQGEERILALAKRCQQVNGIFTLLWHNTSLMGEWESWAPVYRRVLPRLAALEKESAFLETKEVV